MTPDPPVARLMEIAATTAPVAERAQRLLEVLAGWLPADATWLALADPDANIYAARCVDQRPASAACPIPAGHRTGIGVPLVEPGGPYVGTLTLMFLSDEPPSPALRGGLARLAPVIARGVSPMRSLLATTRLVQGATSGAVLFRDGSVHPLPGLDGHALLDAHSPVVGVARDALVAGQVYRSFMWPVSDTAGVAEHARMTVLAATDVPPFVLGTLLMTPNGDCRGLTSRELEVLGLLADGFSNQQIARRLTVAARTVAAHVEHIMHKLDVPSRTMAAIQAERSGCYVPLHGGGSAGLLR